jgi:predicted nucleotidyltransferase
MTLQPDFKEFIQLLNAKGVKYLIVGGYAVGFHGKPRYTGDMDFWIQKSISNATLIKESLDAFGFSSFNLSSNEFIKDNLVLQLGYEPVRIDILTDISGLNFDDCYPRKIVAKIDNVDVPFIHLTDLKINKASTGRAKDLGDLENL